MEAILGRALSRSLDASWISRGVPGLVLMENAGRGAADAIAAHIRASKGPSGPRPRVVVMCGPGNNGGDGFVVARRLHVMGFDVRACFLGSVNKLPVDAAQCFSAYIALGAKLSSTLDLAGAEWVVDALFGTGVTRPLEGDPLAWVRTTHGHRVLALDVPSGLDADTGEVLGAAVCAECTFTFGALKPGLMSDIALPFVGKVQVIDIGVPAPTESAMFALSSSDLGQFVKAREVASHKYTHGHVLIVGGAEGTEGAAELSARAALRAGAGLVTRASRATAGEGIAEVMRVRAPQGPEMATGLASLLSRKSAVVVGPGLGRDPEALDLVLGIVNQFQGPVVLDADALRVGTWPRTVGPHCILTPHVGELSTILGVPSQTIERDRFAALRDAVTKTGATVVLKGARTLVGAPSGEVRASRVGTPAMATAGSGDVLAGMIGAMACSLPPFEAAQAGVLLHACAGEAWAARHGDRGLLASELADLAPELLRASLHT